MSNEVQAVQDRLRTIIATRYGRVEEQLLVSGLVDSLGAIELATILEREFGLDADNFELSDLATITSLSERIMRARRA